MFLTENFMQENVNKAVIEDVIDTYYLKFKNEYKQYAKKVYPKRLNKRASSAYNVGMHTPDMSARQSHLSMNSFLNPLANTPQNPS